MGGTPTISESAGRFLVDEPEHPAGVPNRGDSSRLRFRGLLPDSDRWLDVSWVLLASARRRRRVARVTRWESERFCSVNGIS